MKHLLTILILILAGYGAGTAARHAVSAYQNQFVPFQPTSIEQLAAMPEGSVRWRGGAFWMRRSDKPEAHGR